MNEARVGPFGPAALIISAVCNGDFKGIHRACGTAGKAGLGRNRESLAPWGSDIDPLAGVAIFGKPNLANQSGGQIPHLDLPPISN
jgi:hypothetical protein